MTITDEDAQQFRKRLTHSYDEDAGAVSINIRAFATVVWNEEVKHGSPEMSGYWELTHWDFHTEQLDLPKSSVEQVTAEARKRLRHGALGKLIDEYDQD